MPPTSHPGIEELLAQSEWLMRLARRLASDADADDLAQETWLAALRSPPDPQRPPRPWLTRVVHNVRRMSARTDGRRRTREAVAGPEVHAPVPDTHEMLERVRLQRQVAQLVLQLEEPYRSAVLLRFYDGRSSPEASRALGVPEGTLRWRL